MDETEGAPFDPKTMAEAAERADLLKLIAPETLSGLDPERLAAAQEANMAALINSQIAAAAEYQEAFEAGVADLLKMLEAARQSDGAKAHEQAVAGFQALAEAAKEANLRAFEGAREEIAKNAASLTGPKAD